MKRFLIGSIILVTGCGVNMFAASTKVTYTRPDGTSASYESNKQQEGLDVSFTEVAGKPTSVKIHVDKATTPEEAIKAALEANMGLQDLLKQMIAAGMAAK